MSDLRIDTPKNIDSLTDQQIAELCTSFGKVKSAKLRVKFAKLMYTQILKYDLSNDLLYALADEPKEQFMLAPAGGGKTTTVSAKLALEKIYRSSEYSNSGKAIGSRFLSLVYNRENVNDVISKHQDVIRKINMMNIEGLDLDYDVNCSTMHSFCIYWTMENATFSGLLGISGYKLIDESFRDSIINGGIVNFSKRYNITPPKSFNVSKVLNLINYMAETFSSIEDLKDSNLVVDLGVPIELVSDVINSYAKTKKMIRRLDFTDTLVNFNRLVKEFPEAREAIQKSYDFITADEIQDFTPLLMDNLRYIVGPHANLVCIGDDDQSIYGFRGADNNNALKFGEMFPESKIHLLRTNRRCPSNILNLANNIICLNNHRFNKEMLGIKGPGNIYFNGYHNRISQYQSIARLVAGMKDEERNNTVIGFREGSSSYVLSILMYNNNQPFRVAKGYGPFDYGLFNAVTGVMNIIKNSNDKRKLLGLYKVMPVTKKEMETWLSYDRENDKFLDGQDTVEFDKIDFPSSRFKSANFTVAYDFLKQVISAYDFLPCSEYMPNLIELIRKYYWNYISSNNNIPSEIEGFCIEHVYNFFNSRSTYAERYSKLLEIKNRLKAYNLGDKGAVLSTFHSLKGLEFNNVILCDLAESIFPNYSAIDFRMYDEATKISLKEEENRLMYVAVTRAKNNIWFFYDKSDPSYYISFLKDESLVQSKMATLVNESTDIEEEEEDDSIFTPINAYVHDVNNTSGVISADDVKLKPNSEEDVDKFKEEVKVAPEVILDGEVEEDKEPMVELEHGVKINKSSHFRKNLVSSIFNKDKFNK